MARILVKASKLDAGFTPDYRYQFTWERTNRQTVCMALETLGFSVANNRISVSITALIRAKLNTLI